MFRGLSIQHKLLLTSAVSIVAAFVLAGVLWSYLSYAQHRDYFEQRIHGQATLVASNIGAAVLFDDWEVVGEALDALQEDGAIREARLIGPRGDPLVATTYPSVVPDRGALRTFRVPVMDENRLIAELQIVASNGEVRSTLWRSVQMVSLVALLSLIVGLFVANQMQGAITRPVRKLSALARRVKESHNYSLRGESVHPDEVGRLTDDFNAMLDIVAERDRDLERIVEERTLELQRQNRELEYQISERSRAESEKWDSHERFEQAFHHAPIGMALIGHNMLIQRRNALFDRMMGSADETDLSTLTLVEEEWREAVRDGFAAVVGGSEETFEAELRCQTMRGESVWAVFSVSAVRDADDRFRYAVLQIQDITELKKVSEELEYQAGHDVLTGLANRRVLNEAIDESVKSLQIEGSGHTLCILDLDQFKAVNDACGHAGGDELLRRVAYLLQSLTRSGDLVARLGGDEFAVLLYECAGDDALEIMERIRAQIEQLEFNWSGQTYRIGVSIGAVAIDLSNPEITLLLEQADAACYAAKENGRNRVHFVTRSDAELKARRGEMAWVQRIHEAMKREEFELVSQVILPLQDTSLPSRSEILLRLRDQTTNELIPPGAFLPAAERYGLTPKLDAWVVQRLIRHLKETPALLDQTRSFWLNLSGNSLGDPNFSRSLTAMIKESGLPRGTLNFEITETAVIKNISSAMHLMSDLKALGCAFALDDFGSGVSSFGYLKSLPVDYIKIDGMFVRDILEDRVDRIFVKSIIDIAATMDIQTVGEFVENDAIAALLEELGADYGQGYALGRPEPLELPVSLRVALG